MTEESQHEVFPPGAPETVLDPVPETGDEQLRSRLGEELDRLIERLQSVRPEYAPPPFSPQRLIELIERNLDRFSPDTALALLKKLRASINSDLLDLDTWRGIWYMLNYSL